jgi:hypothetical protein
VQDKKREGAIPLGTQARVVWCKEDRKQFIVIPSLASDSNGPNGKQQSEYLLTAPNEEEAWKWVEAISAFTPDTVDTDHTPDEDVSYGFAATSNSLVYRTAFSHACTPPMHI